jgi:hypothetical protein
MLVAKWKRHTTKKKLSPTERSFNMYYVFDQIQPQATSLLFSDLPPLFCFERNIAIK